jgi:hypothetical protein
VKAGHSADYRGIVAESSVAMDFTEVGKDAINVVKRLRALRMAGEFGLLPCCLHAFQFFPQRVETRVQIGQLAMGVVIFTGRGFNGRNLPLDLV